MVPFYFPDDIFEPFSTLPKILKKSANIGNWLNGLSSTKTDIRTLKSANLLALFVQMYPILKKI